MEKRRKTYQDNKLAAAQDGTKHGDTWFSAELKKLLKAVEACGKRLCGNQPVHRVHPTILH